MIPDMSVHDAPLRVFTMSEIRSQAAEASPARRMSGSVAFNMRSSAPRFSLHAMTAASSRGWVHALLSSPVSLELFSPQSFAQ